MTDTETPRDAGYREYHHVVEHLELASAHIRAARRSIDHASFPGDLRYQTVHLIRQLDGLLKIIDHDQKPR